MMMVNLRESKSPRAFAIPPIFLAATLFTIAVGFFRSSPALDQVTGVGYSRDGSGLSVFAILRAFSSGSAALTGIEAISNGIPAFKEPKSRNAGITLVWMSAILSIMFFSVTFLARHIGALPSHTETVFSQLGRVIYSDDTLPYLILLGSTTLILIMAANTSFAGFPRLSATAAADGFLPKQLTYRGSRLVFTYGIVTLAGFASLLIVIFGAKTNSLIPLYAIGVFLSFTLSQAGMAVRWWKSGQLQPGEEQKQIASVLHHDPKWKLKLAVNGFGSVCTAVVMVIFAVTKFVNGAWVVVILIPTLVILFLRSTITTENWPPNCRWIHSAHRRASSASRPGYHRRRASRHAPGRRITPAVSNDVTAVYVAGLRRRTEIARQVALGRRRPPACTIRQPVVHRCWNTSDDRPSIQSNEILTVVCWSSSGHGGIIYCTCRPLCFCNSAC